MTNTMGRLVKGKGGGKGKATAYAKGKGDSGKSAGKGNGDKGTGKGQGLGTAAPQAQGGGQWDDKPVIFFCGGCKTQINSPDWTWERGCRKKGCEDVLCVTKYGTEQGYAGKAKEPAAKAPAAEEPAGSAKLTDDDEVEVEPQATRGRRLSEIVRVPDSNELHLKTDAVESSELEKSPVEETVDEDRDLVN